MPLAFAALTLAGRIPASLLPEKAAWPPAWLRSRDVQDGGPAQSGDEANRGPPEPSPVQQDRFMVRVCAKSEVTRLSAPLDTSSLRCAVCR